MCNYYIDTQYNGGKCYNYVELSIMLVIMINYIFIVTRKLVQMSILLVHFNYEELYIGIHGYKKAIKSEIYKNKSKSQ